MIMLYKNTKTMVHSYNVDTDFFNIERRCINIINIYTPPKLYTAKVT